MLNAYRTVINDLILASVNLTENTLNIKLSGQNDLSINGSGNRDDMAYYPKDAAVMEHLRKQIESLGIPLLLMRKFNQLTGAISVQVEDEFTSRQVIETVFGALIQQAEEIRQPESDRIKTWIEECRVEIDQRLTKREARTKPSMLSARSAPQHDG